MGIETFNDTATIANGASLSDIVHLQQRRLFGIQMPAAWTAANLTFQGSYDGTTYNDLYDDAGTEVSVTAAASRFIIMVTPAKFLGIQRLKIRSGTTGVAVNQGAERLIRVISIA